MKKLLREPALVAGLVARLALIAFATPLLHLHPVGGSSWVFPAIARAPASGLPLDALAALIASVGGMMGAASLVLALAMLAADIAIFEMLGRTGPVERRDEVARLYWLSPLVIWLIYANGTLAAVTATVLLASFIMLERHRFARAGLGFGLACALQPALIVLVAPIMLLFVASLARLRNGAREMLGTMAAVLGLLLVLPVLLLPAFRDLVITGSAGLFALHLPLGAGAAIAILPTLIAALLYVMWRVRLIDRHLLWTFVTLALLAAVLCGAASAEIALLVLVFLCHHAAYAERSGRLGLFVLSALLLFTMALRLPGPVVTGVLSGQPLAYDLAEGSSTLGLVALPTLLSIVAGVVGAQVVVRGIARFQTYLVSRRPVAVGIAGDSGVGKDTLSSAVAAMFWPLTVAVISGDDYHNWDRNKPMWRALTHLNPRANDLALFARHVTQLIDRRWTRARHYDHASGRMTKPMRIHTGELVIASGLHALSSPTLNALYDLRIYLEMDEDLRQYYKIRRDVYERGHPLENVLASMERRRGDAAAYIHPQKKDADLVLRLLPRHPDRLEHATGDVPKRLVIDGAPGTSFDPVVRALVAIADIFAVELPKEAGGVELIVEGEPAPADIAAASRQLASRPDELMREEPIWEGGTLGVMQLVMLHMIEQTRYRRSVNA